MRLAIAAAGILMLSGGYALAQDNVPAPAPMPADTATPMHHHHHVHHRHYAHHTSGVPGDTETPIDKGPDTPEANKAYQGGGVILQGPPGGPAPTSQATPPGQVPANSVPPV